MKDEKGSSREHVYRSLGELKPHEEIQEKRLEQVKEEIEERSALDKPLLVDRRTGVILDGHHRYYALRDLKVSNVPVIEVDYREDESIVLTKGPGFEGNDLSKEDVIEKGLSEQLFPPKSTKHQYQFDSTGKDFPLEMND